MLELAATEGLNQDAIGRTRLRVGEGIVGLCAATGAVMNLPDAQNHPAFAYRPETERNRSPPCSRCRCARAGRTLGVLVVQNRTPRNFTEREVDDLETVAMLLAEMLPAAGATDGSPEGPGRHRAARCSRGRSLMAGIAVGPVVLLRPARPAVRCWPTIRRRSRFGWTRRSTGCSAGWTTCSPTSQHWARGGRHASREVLEAYRLVAADAGWLRRVGEVIRGGMTAEAAVQRVAGELHDRMRRISDPYLRERLADMEDLANRLLAALTGEAPTRRDPRRRDPACPPARPGRAAGLARPRHRRRGDRGGQPGRPRRDPGSRAGHPGDGQPARHADSVEEGDDAVIDADEGQLILRPEAEVRAAYLRAQETRERDRPNWRRCATSRRRPRMG